MKKRILMVDEDERYAKKLTQLISPQGYEITHLTTPIKAVAEFTKKNYDLVISDFLMQEMDGIRLILILKEISPHVRSIILTEFPDEKVEMDAIDGNVDHYFSKDRNINILFKYIQALLKQEVQKKDISSNILSSSIEQISVDTKKRVVLKENHLVSLTVKEYELLVLFLRNKGTALSREKIAEELWSNEIEKIDLRVIDGHIKRLRAKLSLFSISSVRGYGYKWSE